MTKAYVYACSNDLNWLEIVKKTEDESLAVEASQWPEKLCDSISCSSNQKSKALVLIDSFQQADIKVAVQRLREQGWKYVVVVAGRPSPVEAHTVLYRNLGYDYWKKTYNMLDVRSGIDVWLEEIDGNNSLELPADIVVSTRTDNPEKEREL